MQALPRRSLAALAGLSLGAPAGRASAQAYPAKPIRIIVGAGPGGTADLYARLIARHLSEKFSRPVVVENRAGASSTIAAGLVAAAPPDGYTLLLGASNTHAINPFLMKSLSYDPVRSFSPVSLFATGALLLMIRPATGIASVPELIAYARTHPGATFGSTSIGTGQHMAGELLKLRTRTDLVHVPYTSGSGQMLAGLLAGDVLFAFDNITSALPMHNEGMLRALAISSANRLETLPSIPAMSEFVPDFDIVGWHGIWGPAGMPRAVVEQLSAEIQEMVRDPETNRRIRDLGGLPIGSTPEALDAHVRRELGRYGQLIAEAGLRAE